jgi:hypothetical protein
MSATTLLTNHFAPAWKCYDTAAAVQGADANESALIEFPAYIQMETPVGSNTLTIYAKVHADAPWTIVGTGYTSANTNPLVSFAVPPNFAKIVRSGATSAAKAWAQRATP